jgi:putative hydrolase of the HAD superfamily
MTKAAALFDLGETLVAYYTRPEFPLILDEALGNVRAELTGRGLPVPPAEEVAARAVAENHEAPDYRVRPLAGRLARIFGPPDWRPTVEESEAMCRRFMAPIFRRAALYDDVRPTLIALRAAGLRLAIVSNTPWGSPAMLWREEVARLGLADMVDATVFCDEAGWRKPARPIFELALARLGVGAGESLFVGDNLAWDVAGARAAGIDAVCIDRRGTAGAPADMPVIAGLRELLSLSAGLWQGAAGSGRSID